MMNASARLIVECGKRRTVLCISDLDCAIDEFAKALLIAYFFTESHNTHEDNLLAQDSYLEDLA